MNRDFGAVQRPTQNQPKSALFFRLGEFMKPFLTAAFAGLMLVGMGLPVLAAGEDLLAHPPGDGSHGHDPKADLQIYTGEGTRGYRVAWIAEELGIPYNDIFQRGKVIPSIYDIRKVNPLMGQSPTIFYKGTMMVESSAILDFLQDRYGKGRLAPKKDSPDYMDYLQWLHFAEGSALPVMFSEIRGGRYANIGPNIGGPVQPLKPGSLVGTEQTLNFIEAYLTDHPYFGGQNFSAADIMMDFVAVLAPDPNYFSIDMSKYPHFVAWQKKVESRPAYLRAMDVALPDHQECRGLRIPGCVPKAKPN